MEDDEKIEIDVTEDDEESQPETDPSRPHPLNGPPGNLDVPASRSEE